MRFWRIRRIGNGAAPLPDQRAVPVVPSDPDGGNATEPLPPSEPAPSEGSTGQRSRPGSPFADAVRGVPPCPLRVRSAPECGNLDQVLSRIREIAVWAGNEGRVQDTGRFLLLDAEGFWHSVAVGDAQGAELIARMRAIPGFDTNLLLDALSSRSGQIEPLWPPRAVAGTRR